MARAPAVRLACAWVLLCGPAAAAAQSWVFEARLDGRRIGEHRFTLLEVPPQRELRSEARFEVRLLGLVVYRYEHVATERWNGDCLASLAARTQDNGKLLEVSADTVAGGLRVQQQPASGGPAVLPGCVMGFAYWNPALRSQTQLLNVQTGALEPVRIERLPDAPVEVRGVPVPAVGWRIHAQGQAIDTWYGAVGGAWIGLDARLAGGRRLTYRLPAEGAAARGP